VLNAISGDNIDCIDSLHSGLAFLHDQEAFTARVVAFFEQ